jgi:hypothetical protein
VSLQTGSSGITLITCTGGRPEALALCRKYVMRQTWRGPLQWIVVDDVEPRTVLPDFGLDVDVRVLHPEPSWGYGQNTLARNILAAIPEVKYSCVLFIEDDDWYAPGYLEFMHALLQKNVIVGEAPAHYYHVPSRRGLVLPNKQHASLCQTGIRSSLLYHLLNVCRATQRPFIDVRLWENMPLSGLRADSSLFCVGMKGLPGRAGIGIGHRPENNSLWRADSEGLMLACWVGFDAKEYERFMP